MITVVHLITGLGVGGAEMALKRLVTGLDPTEIRNVVVCIRPVGPLGREIAAAGVEVHSLDVGGPGGMLAGALRLFRLLRRTKPDILQTWLYHSDLLGALVRPFAAASARLVWNIRNADMRAARRLSWNVLLRVLARLSSRPDAVISNSRLGIRVHEEIGYKPKSWVYIPNGFDASQLGRNAMSRSEARASLGLRDDDVVIAMAARYDPTKGYATFAEAAGLACGLIDKVVFVLIGPGVTNDNAELTAVLDKFGVRDRVRLLGERRDFHALAAGFDCMTLTSDFGEGFPNVVGEAMALEVPVVATAVGDVTTILGEYGFTAPPRDPQAIAQAWRKAAALAPDERKRLVAGARAVIDQRYSIPHMLDSYRTLYLDLARRSER